MASQPAGAAERLAQDRPLRRDTTGRVGEDLTVSYSYRYMLVATILTNAPADLVTWLNACISGESRHSPSSHLLALQCLS